MHSEQVDHAQQQRKDNDNTGPTQKHLGRAAKKGDEIIGSRVKVKVVKNKVAPPFKKAEFDIMFNQGISYEGDVANTGIKYGVTKKSAASYSYGKQRLGVGLEKAKQFLRENPKILKEIITDIKEKLKEEKK